MPVPEWTEKSAYNTIYRDLTEEERKDRSFDLRPDMTSANRNKWEKLREGRN